MDTAGSVQDHLVVYRSTAFALAFAPVLVLANCGPKTFGPYPLDSDDRGQTLPADQWQALSNGNAGRGIAPSEIPAGCQVGSPLPESEAEDDDCGNGYWLTKELAYPPAGILSVNRVVQTSKGFIVYYSGNHPCGTDSQAPYFRLLLPLPVRPIEPRDESPGGSCGNRP